MEKLTYIRKNIWKTILLLGTVSLMYGKSPSKLDKKILCYGKNNENNIVSIIFVSEGTKLFNESLITIKDSVSSEELAKTNNEILFVKDGTLISNVQNITISSENKRESAIKKQDSYNAPLAKKKIKSLNKTIQKSTKVNFLITTDSIFSNRFALYGEFCCPSQNNDHNKQLVTIVNRGIVLLTLYYDETLYSDKIPDLILLNISNDFSIRPPPSFTFHKGKNTNSYI